MLLANIYLDALDKELEKRGLRFARYADDCNIHAGSPAAAERVLESLTGWITRHLRLEVSASKKRHGTPVGTQVPRVHHHRRPAHHHRTC